MKNWPIPFELSHPGASKPLLLVLAGKVVPAPGAELADFPLPLYSVVLRNGKKFRARKSKIFFFLKICIPVAKTSNFQRI